MTVDINYVLGCESLPTLPAVGIKALELAREEEPDTREMIRVIKSDPALASRLLAVVNSAYFGLRYQVTSIDHAGAVLGSVPLTCLVLSFSLMRSTTGRGLSAHRLQGFWRNSLTQAVAADELAQLRPTSAPGESFAVGLIQDIGALALLRTVPEEYLAVLDKADRTDRPLVELEQQLLGLTHTNVGAELCRKWGLAERVGQAIAGHHAMPDELKGEEDTDYFALRTSVATAAWIGDYFYRVHKRAAWDLVRAFGQRYHGLEGDNLHDFLSGIGARVSYTAELFDLNLGECPSYNSILAAAQKELAKIAIRTESSVEPWKPDDAMSP